MKTNILQNSLRALLPGLAVAALIGCGGSGPGASSTAEAVGRRESVFTDPMRNEAFGGAGGKRKLGITLWYPAKPAAGTAKGPFLNTAQAESVGNLLGFPSSALQALPTISTIDTSIASTRIPYRVLIMSHGNSMTSLMYTTTAEYLANQGYVVVGVTHSYNALFALLEGGSAVGGDDAAKVEGQMPVLTESSGYAEYTENWNNVQKLGDIFVKDISFVIDELEKLNASEGPFQGQLNTTAVGVFGHSFGGSHCFGALNNDPRVAAAAIVDGTIWNSKFATGTTKPLLVIAGKRSTPEEVEAYRASLIAQGMTEMEANTVVDRTQSDEIAFSKSPGSVHVKVKKALHSNFTDLGLWVNYGFPADELSSEASAESLLQTTNRHLGAFFDEKLRNRSSSLLRPRNDSEVEVRVTK